MPKFYDTNYHLTIPDTAPLIFQAYWRDISTCTWRYAEITDIINSMALQNKDTRRAVELTLLREMITSEQDYTNTWLGDDLAIYMAVRFEADIITSRPWRFYYTGAQMTCQ